MPASSFACLQFNVQYQPRGLRVLVVPPAGLTTSATTVLTLSQQLGPTIRSARWDVGDRWFYHWFTGEPTSLLLRAPMRLWFAPVSGILLSSDFSHEQYSWAPRTRINFSLDQRAPVHVAALRQRSLCRRADCTQQQPSALAIQRRNSRPVPAVQCSRLFPQDIGRQAESMLLLRRAFGTRRGRSGNSSPA